MLFLFVILCIASILAIYWTNPLDVMGEELPKKNITYLNGLHITYPSNLSTSEASDPQTINFYLNNTSSQSLISIQNLSHTDLDLESFTSEMMKRNEKSHIHFYLDNMNYTKVINQTAFSIYYSYQDNISKASMKAMDVYSIINDYAIVFTYKESVDRYSDHLSIAKEILHSLSVKTMAKEKVIPSFKFTKISDIYIDPDTNILYIADGSNTVLVSDRTKGGPIKNITVGSRPNDLAFIKDYYLYIANAGDNNISVVDPDTKKVVKTIPTGQTPNGIAVDPNLNDLLVFVSNSNSNSISIINGDTFQTYATLPVGKHPYGIDVNPITNKAYVANTEDSTISVLDYNKSPVQSVKPKPIHVSEGPKYIGINKITNTIYVSTNDILWAIDGRSNTINRSVELDGPGEIAVDEKNNHLYYSNPDHPLLYILDGKDLKLIDTIKLSTIPSSITINQKQNVSYIGSKTFDQFYMINTTSKKPLAATFIKINDPKLAHLQCNNDDKRYGDGYNNYLIFEQGNRPSCRIVNDKPDINLDSLTWISDKGYDKTLDTHVEFIPDGYGLLNVTLSKIPVYEKVFNENKELFIALITGVIMAPIIQFIMPYLMEEKNKKKQLYFINIQVKQIKDIYEENKKNKEECINLLEKKYIELVNQLKEGDINGFTFQTLYTILNKYILKITEN